MKKLLSLAAIATVGAIFSCQTDDSQVTTNQIPQDVLSQIKSRGFSTHDVKFVDGGYLVEGDIMLYESDLNSSNEHLALRIAEVEQYRTNNLVTSLPRVITVSISSQLPGSYVAALDEALARYNAEGLTITFQRVAANADISIVRGNGSYLASAGFPTSSGDPHNSIKVNSRAIGNQPQSTVATILAHEIGHCIGFRHTDYMDRSYSCGGAYTNEGASTVGAVHIPGTPTGPESGSFMLACIGSNQNRPFTNNDKVALDYIY